MQLRFYPLSAGLFLALALFLPGCGTLSSRESALARAARDGEIESARALIDTGVDVNASNFTGKSPLSLAGRMGQVEMAKFLIARGANLGMARAACGNFAVTYNFPNEAATCVRTFDRVEAEMADDRRHEAERARALEVEKARQEAETARSLALEAQRTQQLKEIVKEVVAASPGVQQKPVQPAAPTSDVDRPAYKLAERANDFALVVGIGTYSDIPEAQFAQRDAEAVREHLIAAGFPSRNVIALLGDKAGRSSLEKFLETWLPRNVAENSRVFFYFSGHGAPDPKTGETYLIPWDGDPNFLENTGYPVKRLYEKLAALKAKEVIVAMDACFSGAGGRSVLAKGARPLVMKVDTAAASQNLTIFAAAAGDQITSTLEDQGHGTFTYYFLKGLGGEAKDSSGAVTAQGLYDYLKPKVQDAGRRQNRDQEPVLRGPGDRELLRF